MDLEVGRCFKNGKVMGIGTLFCTMTLLPVTAICCLRSLRDNENK